MHRGAYISTTVLTLTIHRHYMNTRTKIKSFVYTMKFLPNIWHNILRLNNVSCKQIWRPIFIKNLCTMVSGLFKHCDAYRLTKNWHKSNKVIVSYYEVFATCQIYAIVYTFTMNYMLCKQARRIYWIFKKTLIRHGAYISTAVPILAECTATLAFIKWRPELKQNNLFTFCCFILFAMFYQNFLIASWKFCYFPLISKHLWPWLRSIPYKIYSTVYKLIFIVKLMHRRFSTIVQNLVFIGYMCEVQ